MTDRGIFDQYLRPSPTKFRSGSRSPTRAVMLDVRLPGGVRKAFPYAVLMGVTLDGGRIGAEFATGTVVIEGARLEPLYKGLTQHRVRSVAVNADRRGFGPSNAVGAPDEPVVTGIHIEDPGNSAP